MTARNLLKLCIRMPDLRALSVAAVLRHLKTGIRDLRKVAIQDLDEQLKNLLTSGTISRYKNCSSEYDNRCLNDLFRSEHKLRDVLELSALDLVRNGEIEIGAIAFDLVVPHYSKLVPPNPDRYDEDSNSPISFSKPWLARVYVKAKRLEPVS